MHSLLIEKDVTDFRNVSVKLPCLIRRSFHFSNDRVRLSRTFIMFILYIVFYNVTSYFVTFWWCSFYFCYGVFLENAVVIFIITFIMKTYVLSSLVKMILQIPTWSYNEKINFIQMTRVDYRDVFINNAWIFQLAYILFCESKIY